MSWHNNLFLWPFQQNKKDDMYLSVNLILCHYIIATVLLHPLPLVFGHGTSAVPLPLLCLPCCRSGSWLNRRLQKSNTIYREKGGNWLCHAVFKRCLFQTCLWLGAPDDYRATQLVRNTPTRPNIPPSCLHLPPFITTTTTRGACTDD